MGIFSRTPRTIEPVPTRLDMAWFRTWTNGIIRDSGVDPTNDTNGIALLMMAGKSIHHCGNELMDQFGGAWAKPILAAYMRSDQATPWGAIEVIAGWERDAVDPLERNLVSLAEIMVEIGPGENGVYRVE